jgi:hypothetical protein
MYLTISLSPLESIDSQLSMASVGDSLLEQQRERDNDSLFSLISISFSLANIKHIINLIDRHLIWRERQEEIEREEGQGQGEREEERESYCSLISIYVR